jgi:hypothetical protein
MNMFPKVYRTAKGAGFPVANANKKRQACSINKYATCPYNLLHTSIENPNPIAAHTANPISLY